MTDTGKRGDDRRSAPGVLTRGQVLRLGGALGIASAAGPFVTACGGNAGGAVPGGKLVIWTFFDQVKIAARRFMKKYPKTQVAVKVFPGDQYETKMRLALQTGKDAPDIFDTDLSYQGKYINSPFAEDLSAMGAEKLIKDYVPYVAGFTKDQKGTIRAIVDHSAPGGFWYRRDIAQKLIGTGDPEEVNGKVDDWDKIIELGQKVVKDSKGKVHLLDSYNAVFEVEQNHMQPWVVNKKLNIDPRWNQALDVMRRIRANNVDAKLDAFSAAWGAAWNNGSVLMFAWPSWAGFNIDRKKTGDNWGIARAPKAYYDGGRYSSIYSKSQNKELAYQYLKFIASPEWQNYNLKKTLNMPALQSVYKSNMDTFKVPLLSGQHVLKTYYPIAMDIPVRRSDKYQKEIQAMFISAVSDMITNHQPNSKALAALKEQVRTTYPEISVK